jgi:hypothetical protein
MDLGSGDNDARVYFLMECPEKKDPDALAASGSVGFLIGSKLPW